MEYVPIQSDKGSFRLHLRRLGIEGEEGLVGFDNDYLQTLPNRNEQVRYMFVHCKPEYLVAHLCSRFDHQRKLVEKDQPTSHMFATTAPVTIDARFVLGTPPATHRPLLAADVTNIYQTEIIRRWLDEKLIPSPLCSAGTLPYIYALIHECFRHWIPLSIGFAADGLPEIWIECKATHEWLKLELIVTPKPR